MPKKKLHSAPAYAPRLRVLLGSITALGPGRADLMEAIARTGSISAAAREMNMSYRRAWELIESTNAAFVEALVVTSAGGSGGGGARVTDFGRGIIERYRDMEQKAAKAVSRDFAAFSKLLKPAAPTKKRAAKKSGAAKSTPKRVAKKSA
jgi:molybdate transport system regulatory protein